MQASWSLFFGRFHPLIVHLPIGILVFVTLLVVLPLFRKKEIQAQAITHGLLAAGISGLLSIFTGYLLSDGGNYDPKLLSWHQWMGILMTGSCWVAWVLRRFFQPNKRTLYLKASNGLLLLAILFIIVGGHMGGSLTHGEGYLTRNLPMSLKSFFGEKQTEVAVQVPKTVDSVIIYRDIVQPILNNKCVGCHNPGKTNGQLDLSSLAGILKGGKSGNTLVAGNPEKSELIYRVSLPPGKTKFMPTDNRPALTPIEIYFLRHWIANGLDSSSTLAKLQPGEAYLHTAAAFLGINEESQKDISLPVVAAADSSAVKDLQTRKLVIKPLTSTSNLLSVSFILLEKKSTEDIRISLQKLLLVKDQVYSLDISHCNLDLGCIELIAQLKRLTELKVQQTKLTDPMIEKLAVLENLISLNLSDNPITDRSVPFLVKISSLRKLNVWNTQVTDEALQPLGNLQVIR